MGGEASTRGGTNAEGMGEFLDRTMVGLKLPPFLRLKQLAKVIQVPKERLEKDICKKHRGKLYCHYEEEGGWFHFKSTAEVIIPYSAAAAYSKVHGISVQMQHLDPYVDMKSCKAQPVVALIGHFNHGKTTLLDSLTSSNFVENEAHAITQVVRSRALQFSNDDLRITLIDTPGQEIFYRMRNFGAAVADIAVLVIAANEGICNQTKEAIGIVESLNIPSIVCINKIDHEDVVKFPRKLPLLREEVKEYIALEKSPIVEISAKLRMNLSSLLSVIASTVKTLPNNAHTPSFSSSSLSPSLTSLSSPARRGYEPCTRNTCFASGTILNMWKDRHHGLVLHIILTSGSISEQAIFSAGGWCGVVRRITIDEMSVYEDKDGNGNANKRMVPIKARVEDTTVFAGQGVRLSVLLFQEEEPRPLGDTIYFLPKEAAIELADQRVMECRFGDHLVSERDLQAYGLPKGSSSSPSSSSMLFTEESNNSGAKEVRKSSKNDTGSKFSTKEYDDSSENEEEDDGIVVVLKTDSGVQSFFC